MCFSGKGLPRPLHIFLKHDLSRGTFSGEGQVRGENLRMNPRILGMTASLLILATTGCATAPLTGSSGEVTGPLRSIELYTKRPERGEQYQTAGRERLFASDLEVYILSHWALPGPGEHVSKVVLLTPTGTIHRQSEYRFQAQNSSWWTVQRLELPQGETARALSGAWQVEVLLDKTRVGRRAFTFDPSSIRLRTDARLVIVQGKDDPEVAAGDWHWRYRSAAMENIRAAHAILGVVLRDELTRRFTNVDAPRGTEGISNATLLLTTNLGVSPNPGTDSRLELEVAHLPSKIVRKFTFKTSAGVEHRGPSMARHYNVDAADLAFQAASNAAVLEFLIASTQAVPE